tara:strand:+ start:526 stop:828 length:303 start_codon:yes stop_codon:yes gene_type:complete
MTVGELKNTLAAVGFIVGTAFVIDARYELAGAERRAVLSSSIYANTLQIAGKGSAIYRYDLLEAAGRLSVEDAARRVQLQTEKHGLEDHSRNLQSQLDAL